MSVLTSSSIAGFELPPAHPDSKLHRILSTALGKLPDLQRESVQAWTAEHFNLHQVPIFQSATPEEQWAILNGANQSLMTEAYFIEQAGVGYMAKMVLLSESQEERMLYGLFAADEAMHLAQIRQFMSDAPALAEDPFLQLLAELIESSDKVVMLFVLQVVLEGWGLTHYHNLAKDCQHPELQACLQGFIAAEARHHGTGITLFNQAQLSVQHHQILIEILTQFLRMIQVGPQQLLKIIEQVKGELSRDQKIQIFESIDTLSHSGIRLQRLRSLIHMPQTHALLQTLDHYELFDPLPAHLCV